MRGSTKTMTQGKKLDGIHRPNNSVYEQRSNDDGAAVASGCAKNIVASVVAKASGNNSNSKKKRPLQSGLASSKLITPLNKSAIGKISLVECSVPATNREQVESRDRIKNSKNRGSVGSRKTPAVGNQSGGQSVHDDNRKPVEMTVITQQNGNDAIRDIQSEIDVNTVDKIRAPRSVINCNNRDVVASKVKNTDFHSEKPINIDLQADRANSGKIPSDENITASVTQQADANDDLEPQQRDKIGGKYDEKLSGPLEVTVDHQEASTEEDPMARLNALRANIANALKEVKAVLEQHAPPAEGNDDNVSATNEKGQDGCVNFRFVRRSRTKSIIKFDDEEIVCNAPTSIAETTASTQENQQKSDTKRNLSPKSKSSETAKAEQIKGEGHLKDNLEQLQVTPTDTSAAKSPNSQEKKLQSESVKAKQLANESKNDNAKHLPLREPKKNFTKAEELAILKQEESKDERGKVDVSKEESFQDELKGPEEIDNEAISSTDRQIARKSAKQNKEGLPKDQDKISKESVSKSQQKSKDNPDEISQKEKNAIKKSGRQLTPESKYKLITTKVLHQEIKDKEVAKQEEAAKLQKASPKLIQKKLECKSKEEISPPEPDERKKIIGNKESTNSAQEFALPKEATKGEQPEPTKRKSASIVAQKSRETTSVTSKGGIKKQQPKEIPKTKEDQASSTQQSLPKPQEIIVKRSSSELPNESGTKSMSKEQTSADKPELMKEADGISKVAKIKETAASELSSKKIEATKPQLNKDVPDKKIEASKFKSTKQIDNSELQSKQVIKTQEGEIPKPNESANTAKTKEVTPLKLPVKKSEESNKPAENEAAKSGAPKTMKKLPPKKTAEEKPKSPVVTLRTKRASLTETRSSAVRTVKPKRASITEGDLVKLSQQTDAQIEPIRTDGNTTAPKSVGKPSRDVNENIVKPAHATTDNTTVQPKITKTESSSVKDLKLPTATVAVTVPAIVTATSKATISNSKPTTVAETTQTNNVQSKQITQPPPQPPPSQLKSNETKLVGASQNQKSSDVITPLISSVVDKIPAKSSASVERPTVNSRSSEMTVVKKDCSNIARKPDLVLDEQLKSDPLIKQTDNRDYEVLKKVPLVSSVESIVSQKNVLPPDVKLQNDIRPNDVGVILNSLSNHTPVLTRAPSIDLKDVPPQTTKSEKIITSKVPEKIEPVKFKELKDIENSTPKLESLRIDVSPKVTEQSESTKPSTTGDTKNDKFTPAEVEAPKKDETLTKIVDKVETGEPVPDINNSNKTPLAKTDFEVISNRKDVVQKVTPEIQNHESSNQKGSLSTDPLTGLAAGLNTKPPHIPASIKTDLTESMAPLKTPDLPATPESPIPPDSPSPLIETTTETTDTENDTTTTKPPAKKRKMKKVIIKRIKRRLSRDETIDKPEICEKPIAEPPIPSAEAETATEPEPEPEQPVVEEPLVPKGPRSCLVRRSYEPGDIVMYADRIRKLVKWRKATVLEKITDISYKLEFESGDQKPAHISYIKKFTDKKVQFGGKEYLEIDYEQENQESEEEEPYNIWARV